MKKKILVIFTGGTIGSEQTGKSVGLNAAKRKLLIDRYTRKYGNEVAFDCLSPINILSENVQKDDLEKLYDCVRATDCAQYDGVIITHGTDTLCFTVNWFSQVMCDFPLPVVFVSALYPIDDERSNGIINFSGAVDFIEQAHIKGIYCSFANDGENAKIHLASRLVWPDEVNGFYHSVRGAHLAEIKDGRVIFNTSPIVPSPEEIEANHPEALAPSLCDEVMLITMRALLNFGMYDFFRSRPRAIIIELSHSGTICTVGDELNFIKFAERCKSLNIPVIISPVMSAAGVYESMSSLPDNVIVAHDITVEMTLVKVMCALGAKKPPESYLTCDLFFEKL